MTRFTVFANGMYWGTVSTESRFDAMSMAASDFGTEGNVEGLDVIEVTAQQEAEVEQWWANGGVADDAPKWL